LNGGHFEKTEELRGRDHSIYKLSNLFVLLPNDKG